MTRWWAVTDKRQPGVVIEPGQDLGAGAAGQRPVGEVGLPALRWAARLRTAGRRTGGAWPGPGMTSPARVRCRLIVAAETMTW